MIKLVVVVIVVAYASSSVVPKPPASHGEVKHDISMVKSIPIHHDHHPSSEKPAEVKAEVKHDEKSKSISHQDMKSGEKKDAPHHPSETKVEHHARDATLKHYDVPVNVDHGHGDKSAHDGHKLEKAESAKPKASDHKH